MYPYFRKRSASDMTSPISDGDNTEYVLLIAYYLFSMKLIYGFRMLPSPTKRIASLQQVRFEPKPLKSAMKKPEVTVPTYVHYMYYNVDEMLIRIH
jgi:hypothetical protein